MAQINKPGLHFNTKIYAGNGSSNAQTGVGFQPDLFWTKSRANAENHTLIDAVRGVGYGLGSNTTAAQYSGTNFGSFDSDGFTWSGNLGSGNENGQTYCSWNWKAGNSSGSSNGDGSVTSTVTVNTTAGFSIVKWTGTGATATVGHGLGVKPSIVLIKNTGATENWVMYHSSLTANYNLKLNNTEAQQDTTGAFNDTEPTTSVFTVHTNTNTNQNGQVMIAYCFAAKPGFSKFGKYTGNGADGSTTNNFIYTGFKPAWVLVKRYNDSGQQWTLCDSVRSPTNVADSMEWLFPDDSGVETDEDLPYLLSNGFMPRTGHVYMNRNGFQYIYLAFAENPLVGTNNIPAVGR